MYFPRLRSSVHANEEASRMFVNTNKWTGRNAGVAFLPAQNNTSVLSLCLYASQSGRFQYTGLPA